MAEVWEPLVNCMVVGNVEVKSKVCGGPRLSLERYKLYSENDRLGCLYMCYNDFV